MNTNQIQTVVRATNINESSFRSKNIMNNSNMFAGDQAYKMTKYLNFQTKATEVRYYSGMIKRTRLIRQFLTFTTIFCLLLLCILKITKFIYILILIFIAILTRFPKFEIHKRMLFFLIEFCIIRYISKFFFNYLVWIVILTLYDYAINFYHLMKWYFNLITHLILFLLINYKYSEQIEIDQQYLFIVLIVLSSSFLYGYNERILKENWILFDTFKRSGRIFENIFNESIATLTLTRNGSILYGNSSALQLLNISKLSTNSTLKDYIYPNYLLEFFDSVNSAFLKGEKVVNHILIKVIPNQFLMLNLKVNPLIF